MEYIQFLPKFSLLPDGHVVDSAFVFGVGEAVIPSQASSTTNVQSQLYIPNAIARFPALVGQVMVVGATLLDSLVMEANIKN